MTGKAVGPWALLGLLALVKVGVAWTLPITTDEAYYVDWSRALDFGYFDHPPLVALWTSLVNLSPQPLAILARLGSLLTWIITFIVSKKLFALWFASSKDVLLALVVCWGSLAGFAYGLLVTPDVPLLLFWLLALYFAESALSQNAKTWIAAGVVTGLGLLAKYTMVLIGPVFLIAMLKKQRAFLQPWAYLGGLVAFGIFATNISWNANHDWITFQFQWRHGQDSKRDEMIQTAIPRAQKAPMISQNYVLSAPFADAFWDVKKPETTWTSLAKAPVIKNLISLGDYGAGIVGWFGFVGLCWLGLGLRGLLKKQIQAQDLWPRMERQGWQKTRCLLPGAAVPLFFFCFFAISSKVEANWATMAVPSLSALMVPLFRAQTRLLYVSVLGHITLAVALWLHLSNNVFSIPPHKDRIRKETAGFAQMSAWLADQHTSALFADKFQWVAMLHFYGREHSLRQWPGITRDSEYTRNKIWTMDAEDYQSLDDFLLITSDSPAPFLIDFHLQSIVKLQVCWDKRQAREILLVADQALCEAPIRRAFANRYQRIKD